MLALCLTTLPISAAVARGAEHLFISKVAALPQMVEHTGKHSARSARGRRNDDSPGGVLLAYGQRVGEHQTPALQVVAVAVGLHIVSLCLAPQIQRSRQSSSLLMPRSTAFFIASQTSARNPYISFPRIAPRIPSSIGLCARSTPLCPSWCSSGKSPRSPEWRISSYSRAPPPTENTVHSSSGKPCLVQRCELHAVGMIGQELLRFPYDVDGHIDFLEYIKDGDIGHVAMSGGGQTPVERDFEAFCSTVLGEKTFPRPCAVPLYGRRMARCRSCTVP